MMFRLIGLFICLGIGSAGATEATASGFLQQSRLSGNLGGLHSALADRGVEVGLDYAGEWVRGLAGGQSRQTIYHDNLDLTLNVDAEAAGLWKGGRLFVHGLRNHGADPSASMIGDLQVASNIEAPDQFIVHEAWLEQNFGEWLSLLAGLHDLNSEFYVSEYASLFFNSSFGIGPELSANVPASLFPKAGLGARIRIQPVQASYIQAAVYDGDPATRGFRAGEGRMWIAEIGASADGMAAHLGYWRHTAIKRFQGKSFAHDSGYYGVLDLRLGQWDAGQAGAFVQWGQPAGDRNDVTGYLGYGLHLVGLIPGRSDDELGIAVANARTITGTERTIEATYRLALAGWLSLQPSYQWIIHPGGDRTQAMARVALLRFELNL